MTLNDLLVKEGIDPKEVLVLRHRPTEPQLRKVLPWLAAERPELYNAYQQTQNEQLERAMPLAKFVASFIGHEAGRAIFVGLYTIGGSTPLTRDTYWAAPGHKELGTYGVRGLRDDDPRTTIQSFNLSLTPFYSEWKGKLIIAWPPPERSWWRRSHRNEMSVVAILEESVFDSHMPSWEKIGLGWSELAVLPTRWRSKLSEWRAIYYIFDTSDGKGYVGSAYGAENLLGRWLNYGAKGHGGNVLLRHRDPQNLRFSILQRVSPDMDAADVIQLEGTWKERLHTRQPWGLNEN